MRISLNKSIVFDFDGTLIDISIRDYKVYSDILKGLKREPIPFNIYWEKRKNKEDIKNILALSNIIDKEEVSFFLSERHLKIDSEQYLLLDSLFCNVKDILMELKEKYELYLVTSRHRQDETLKQLRDLEIYHFFEKVYVVNTDKYNIFCDIPNLEYVVGDTENDIIPAKKIGVYSVAVTTGIRSENFLKEMSPSYVIHKLEDFCKIAL